MTKQGPRSEETWIVRLRCVVTKDVVCVGCTEDEDRADPFEFATTETEVEQEDWEVLAVEKDT